MAIIEFPERGPVENANIDERPRIIILKGVDQTSPVREVASDKLITSDLYGYIGFIPDNSIPNN